MHFWAAGEQGVYGRCANGKYFILPFAIMPQAAAFS